MTNRFENPESNHEQAEGDVFSNFEDSAEAIIERSATTKQRVEAAADEMGPDLPFECMGGICPILAQISRAHNGEKLSLAYTLDGVSTVESTLKTIRETAEIRERSLAHVMDMVDEGYITTETAAKKFDRITSPVHISQEGVDDDDKEEKKGEEVSLMEKIESRKKEIEDKKERLERLEALHEGICAHDETKRPTASLVVRKALGMSPREDECFGPKFHPKEQKQSRRFSCTNSKAVEVLHTAIDEGLVELDKYSDHLDARPRPTDS